MLCILEKEDYETLFSLIRVSEAIEKIYDNLCSLEINGKKNSVEYRRNLDYLITAKEVEKRMYDENDLNAIKIAELLKYMVEHRMIDYISDNQSLLNHSIKNNSNRRVYNLLNHKMLDDYPGINELEHETMGDAVGTYNTMIELNYKRSLIESAINKECYLMFLKFLLEDIDTIDRQKAKRDFLEIKYNLSFINLDVENELLYSKFNVPSTIFVSSNVLAHCYELSCSEYFLLQNKFCFSNALEQIVHLLSFNDLQYLDVKNQNMTFIHSCLLRSYLAFLSDLSILELHNSFISQLVAKSKESIKHYSSEKVIQQCFYNLYVDRNKQVSLKLVK